MSDFPQYKQQAVEDLIPYARNARTHSEEQVDKIAASIREFGFLNPVITDGDNGIVAGHGRIMAAKKLGMDEVPTVEATHLTDAQKRAYILADNRLALDAGWDDELLRVEFTELQDAGFDLNLTGFTDDEIAALEPDPEPEEGLTDEDAVPEEPETPVTVEGDVWVLGNHRLMCGDATSVDAVERLMDGNKADLCFTSPPYALGKSVSLSGNRSMAASGSAYDGHDDDPAQWAEMMNEWWAASFGAVDDLWLVNVQPLAGNKRDLIRWVNDRVDRLIDIVTWDKGHAAPQMAAGVMASRYEWIVCLGHEGSSRAMPKSSWQGTVQSVYQAPPQRANDYSDQHAATMPVHLPEWVLQTLCDQAKSVYDPFCGTGTTLIAAQTSNSKCFALEISPSYCDVTIQRWQDFTGQQAVHEETGKTFDEVANA